MIAHVLGAIRGSIGSTHGAKDDAHNRRHRYRTEHDFLLLGEARNDPRDSREVSRQQKFSRLSSATRFIAPTQHASTFGSGTFRGLARSQSSYRTCPRARKAAGSEKVVISCPELVRTRPPGTSAST